jgi:hypothetical protein
MTTSKMKQREYVAQKKTKTHNNTCQFCSTFNLGPVWQGSGSSKNGSGSGSSGGVASLVELSRFKKRLAK